MAPIRITLQDFLSAIRSQTGKSVNATSPNVYGASINADGTVTVTRNGVVIFPRIFYLQGQQITGQTGDLNQDSLVIFSNNGVTAVGGVASFLATLN